MIETKRRIIAIGGGAVPPSITQAALDLAAGPESSVLICALGSGLSDSAERLARELFTERHGLKDVRAPGGLSGYIPDESPLEKAAEVRKQLDAADLLQAIEQVDLVFFSGGDQRNYLKFLPGSQFWEVLKRRFDAGKLLVMGTSAGLQMLSEWALTGSPSKDFSSVMGEEFDEGISAERTEVVPGMGLVPGVLFDQHFLRRKRHNRLFSGMLSCPARLAIGVDENTALVLEEGKPARVLGDSSVFVLVPQVCHKTLRYTVEIVSSGGELAHPLPLAPPLQDVPNSFSSPQM